MGDGECRLRKKNTRSRRRQVDVVAENQICRPECPSGRNRGGGRCAQVRGRETMGYDGRGGRRREEMDLDSSTAGSAGAGSRWQLR
ncbi:hypothetical protein ACLOJK_004672 [Asimina triloba]